MGGSLESEERMKEDAGKSPLPIIPLPRNADRPQQQHDSGKHSDEHTSNSSDKRTSNGRDEHTSNSSDECTSNGRDECTSNGRDERNSDKRGRFTTNAAG